MNRAMKEQRRRARRENAKRARSGSKRTEAAHETRAWELVGLVRYLVDQKVIGEAEADSIVRNAELSVPAAVRRALGHLGFEDGLYDSELAAEALIPGYDVDQMRAEVASLKLKQAGLPMKLALDR